MDQQLGPIPNKLGKIQTFWFATVTIDEFVHCGTMNSILRYEMSIWLSTLYESKKFLNSSTIK